jgi:hypothetical protein
LQFNVNGEYCNERHQLMKSSHQDCSSKSCYYASLIKVGYLFFYFVTLNDNFESLILETIKTTTNLVSRRDSSHSRRRLSFDTPPLQFKLQNSIAVIRHLNLRNCDNNHANFCRHLIKQRNLFKMDHILRRYNRFIF